MSDSVKLTKLFDLPEGTAYSVRIVNNTGDYIDLTNYGARLLDIFVHTPSGTMKNIFLPKLNSDKGTLDEHPETLLLADVPNDLANTLWDISVETDSSVLLSAESRSDIKVGIRVTWVNLNRLILDYFLTPKDAGAVTFSSRLSFDAGKYEAAAFTEEVNGMPSANSEYKSMAFIPIKTTGDVFSTNNEEIKPMLEVKDSASPLRLSFYSTMTCAKVEDSVDHIEINSFPKEQADLLSGETLTERVICGIDYITTNLASDENDPESPFMGFF